MLTLIIDLDASYENSPVNERMPLLGIGKEAVRLHLYEKGNEQRE